MAWDNLNLVTYAECTSIVHKNWEGYMALHVNPVGPRLHITSGLYTENG